MNTRTKVTLSLFLAIAVVAMIAVALYTLHNDKVKLNEQSEFLKEKLDAKDSAYNEIMDIMYSVEQRIEKIKKRENLLTNINSKDDITEEDKDQMILDMSLIDSLIIETNRTVAKLVAKLDNANINLNSFKNRVSKLSKDLETRQKSITMLREELKSKDVAIEEMSENIQTLEHRVLTQDETINTQSLKIAKQESQMYTAYFAINTEKALMEEGLVSKEGGFLWFGKTTELDPNASIEKFIPLDIRETDRLIVNAEDAKLITEHPSESYEMVMDGDVVKFIAIKDPEKFWGISRYLVVAVKS